MGKVKYHVPGISCGHCVNTIEMEIGELEGVSNIESDLSSKQVMIEFGEPVSESQLIELFKEIGYPIQGT